MTYTEEVPANFQPYFPCKRRCCPFQKIYTLNQQDGTKKRFFTYQCAFVERWLTCKRQLEISDKTPKAQAKTEPPKPKTEASKTQTHTEQPTQQPKERPQKSDLTKPTKQQTDHRCKMYPTDCWQCSSIQQDKCAIEIQHRSPPY